MAAPLRIPLGPLHDTFGGSSISEIMLEELWNIEPQGEPSVDTLVQHVGDLEQELRNVEFRVHFLFNQRNDVRDTLASARHRLAEAQKQ